MKKYFKYLLKFILLVILPILLNLIASIWSTPFSDWWSKKRFVLSVLTYHVIAAIFFVLFCGLVGYSICDIVTKLKRKRGKKQISYLDELQQRFSDVANDIDYIQSIQLYTYRLDAREGKEKVRVNYLCGYSKADISINAIQQDCYSIPFKLYNMYNKAAQEFNKYLSEKRPDNWNRYKADTSKIADELKNLLFVDDRIDDAKCCLYRLLRAQCSNINIVGETEIVDFILDPEDRSYETSLLEYKRTGLLPSVFFDNSHFFRNVSSGEKNGRVYMTCRFHSVEKYKRCILLFALDGTSVSGNKTVYEIEEDIKGAFKNV